MRDVRPSSPQGSCFRRLRSGVRRVKPSSWNGRGRDEAERGRGRQRERARPFGPGPVQAQPRALGAAWACLTIGGGRRSGRPRLERKAGMWGIGHSKARLRTRTAKALWLPVRLGARARLSASVSRAGTGREDASTAVPNCGHQGAPEEEEEGGGGGEREKGSAAGASQVGVGAHPSCSAATGSAPSSRKPSPPPAASAAAPPPRSTAG
ncbi:unnamed protein product, partial [Prorocentrum cordatum]